MAHARGRFAPKNPQKYVGDRTKITFRSRWEKIFMVFLDQNPAVLKWASEEVVVPYISPVDGQSHRYFVDFWMKFVSRDGEIKEKLVEVKPFGQTEPPKNRHARSYKEQVETYMVNRAKWDAAEKYAASRKMDFQLVTENELGLNRKR